MKCVNWGFLQSINNVRDNFDKDNSGRLKHCKDVNIAFRMLNMRQLSKFWLYHWFI